MAYTRTWNEATPTDSDAATTIDDLFRNLKVDIRERLDAVVTDFTVDPVVPLGPATHRVRVTKTANQSTTTAVAATLSWDAETFDVGDSHDNTTNNERITIPANGGSAWLFGAVIVWASDSTGVRQLVFRKNGATVWFSHVAPSPTTNTTMVVVFPLEVVVATDYFDIQGLQASGGALNVLSAGSCFWGMRVV